MQSELYWQQVLSRDPRQDGRFVFAVRTTGVYCRPSCPSRRPRRDSVEFFRTPGDAEKAGYRACLRCKPTQVADQAQYVVAARQVLDAAEGVVTSAELSKRIGISPFHLQRLFKRATGLTPREYQAARRTQVLKRQLRQGSDVTSALYEAGFGAPSRLYESSGQQLGMTPATYRLGAPDTKIKYTVVESALGYLLVASTRAGICSVRFADRSDDLERELRNEFHAAEIQRDDEAMKREIEVIKHAIAGAKVPVELPLDVRATAFQRRVWHELRQIPAGETRSYTEIARNIGATRAVRAVARACASNPVAVAIPCHRVVRSDGALAGYRWGLSRKKKLLEAERRDETSAERR